ncbi:hypothetical protein HETIRDRAFT_46989 [Heterobasidion irregulare TC 32-1]|uniref:Uncharacterized protein n=1 Tax=Heterobasidion irregulare (strain TC 32-1) TaxID=747525 RepID=W4KDK4_HETIT|nr:uncharacterized protein HETIRDRAFT_46989 [Heterobasidion irregulare TC 32-1]ETW83814.1 hypothetical protein HETIRDRAFT_46989 [Heterobasidion irregulare TC 32-1]
MQDLDVSKITNVLKTLSEAAAAANVPLGFLDSLVSQPPRDASSVPVDQNPSSSNRILGIPPKQLAKPVHRSRITNINLPPVDATDNPEHAHMLATKWLSANRLAEMVKTEGLVYKKGKFSAIEEAQLNKAIENYRARTGISQDALVDIIFPRNTKDRDNAFWSEITSAVSLRPIIAVYHHVRRKNHPLKQQGRWMPIEDSMLKHAVAELGQQWEKISDRVGRMASDCRDRYRNHIEHREHRSNGAWTKEEEALLTQIVTEITVSQGKDPDNDVFWGVVSQRMNNKRGRQQCRIKWLDSLSKTVKNQGDKPRWSLVDAYILVHKVHSLNVRDDSEIDWKTLPDANWNFWSAHILQRRWQTMKRGIRGYEDMSHEEIMDILLVKNVHLPVDTGRRQRKIVSAEAVEDSEEDVDDLNQTQSGPALLVDGFTGTARSPTIQPGGNHSSSSSDEE